MTARPYHHGALREALVEAAIAAILEQGPAGWSLRDLARRAGVSHAAPRHHFGDKRGLLTAIAVDGYRRLAGELDAAWERTGSFLEVGVAYVRFAVHNRAHFEVMYRPDLLHRNDPALVAARAWSGERLFGPTGARAVVGPPADALRAAVAAWSLVHGLATLWLNGNLPAAVGEDPEALARDVAAFLFPPSGSSAGPPIVAPDGL